MIAHPQGAISLHKDMILLEIGRFPEFTDSSWDILDPINLSVEGQAPGCFYAGKDNSLLYV